NDRRVPSTRPAAEIALVEHRDVRDAAFAEVVSDGQPVDAGADDDDVVAGLQVVGTPHGLDRHEFSLKLTAENAENLGELASLVVSAYSGVISARRVIVHDPPAFRQFLDDEREQAAELFLLQFQLPAAADEGAVGAEHFDPKIAECQLAHFFA